MKVKSYEEGTMSEVLSDIQQDLHEDTQREIQEKPEKPFNKKEYFMRLFLLVIGIIIVHIGVTLFVITEFGVDSLTCFVQGVSIITNLTIGTAHIMVMCIMTVIIFFSFKGYVKVGTILCALLSGLVIDFCTWLNNGFISGDSPFIVRLIIVFIGVLFIGWGAAIILKTDAGTGTYDLIAVILYDKTTKFQFRTVRVFTDFSATAIGFILGGSLGFGTVLSVIGIGPAIQLFLPSMGKWVDGILEKCRD